MNCNSPKNEKEAYRESGPPGRLKRGKKCGGCKGKKPCAKCSAAKAMKEDALTTKEYLAACDLGVEHKSRTYIRARLDASGKGKKCGGSSIAAGKKCKKGAGMQTERFLKKGGGAVEALGTIAGLTALATGRNSLSNAAFTAASLGSAAKGEGKRREGVRTKNIAKELGGKRSRNFALTIAALSEGVSFLQQHEIRQFKKKHPPGSSHNMVDLTAYRINRGR